MSSVNRVILVGNLGRVVDPFSGSGDIADEQWEFFMPLLHTIRKIVERTQKTLNHLDKDAVVTPSEPESARAVTVADRKLLDSVANIDNEFDGNLTKNIRSEVRFLGVPLNTGPPCQDDQPAL